MNKEQNMDTEQLRAAFEEWAASVGFCVTGKYAETIDVLCAESAFKAGYQAGRAALQAQTMQPEISRDLLGRIVDQVFDGAIEDTAVIEDIYRVIAACAPTPSVPLLAERDALSECRKAAQRPAAPSGAVNVVGMPEFDSLLDHIYEYGTAADGVIERANAFASAVLAQYATQQQGGRADG